MVIYTHAINRGRTVLGAAIYFLGNHNLLGFSRMYLAADSDRLGIAHFTRSLRSLERLREEGLPEELSMAGRDFYSFYNNVSQKSTNGLQTNYT